MRRYVNGQVLVSANGQLKVPIPRCLLSGSCTSSDSGLAHAERLSFGCHDDGVVQEPIEQADGGGVLGQEPAPLVEGPVRADAQGAAFVGGGDEPEQRLGSGVVERGEPDLVHDDRVSTQEVLDDAADGVVGQAPVERLDQVAAAK